MRRTRAADDFATIRARMEELRREREAAQITEQAKVSEQTPVRVNRMGQVSMAILAVVPLIEDMLARLRHHGGRGVAAESAHVVLFPEG